MLSEIESFAVKQKMFTQDIQQQFESLRVNTNSYSIIKTQKKTVSEKIHLNDFLVLAYPDFADKQKVQMEKKKVQLERRLETLKDLNRKENINYYEIMNQKYESFEYLDQIKARREQLEREVMETKKMLKKNHTVSETDMGKGFMKEFKDMYGTEYYEKKKPPLPQPISEKLPHHKLSDRELLDEFIIPNGKDYENKKFFSSYQPDIKEVKNLQQYIPMSNAPRPPPQEQPKQSMLDKFIMKGGSQQNLNGSFRVIPSVRVEDPKKTLSAQRNRHSQSQGGFGNSGQINFEDSRENSPEQGYQQNINSSPNRIPKSNYLQIPGRNVEIINFPYSKKNDIGIERNLSNRKKFE